MENLLINARVGEVFRFPGKYIFYQVVARRVNVNGWQTVHYSKLKKNGILFSKVYIHEPGSSKPSKKIVYGSGY